jgi:hypothetical protein
MPDPRARSGSLVVVSSESSQRQKCSSIGFSSRNYTAETTPLIGGIKAQEPKSHGSLMKLGWQEGALETITEQEQSLKTKTISRSFIR